MNKITVLILSLILSGSAYAQTNAELKEEIDYLTLRQKVLDCSAGFQPASIYSAGKMPAPQYMTLQYV